MSPPASISEIYDLLVSLLVRCPQTIEILPGDGSIWTQTQENNGPEPSYAPFLFVERNLGVPQKVLYKVYLHAVNLFKFARGRIPTQSLLISPPARHDLDSSLVPTLTASSSILVLANPSHQTALNVRKHLVQMDLIDPQNELRFTASLLSSHHCTKNSELWHHRRWLLSTACDPLFTDAIVADPHRRLHFTSEAAIRQELDLVYRACELYPRNYFAWMHRLACMRSLLSDYFILTDTIGFVLIFRDEITGLKRWIERHVSDYSAVHAVLTLSQAVLQSGDSSLMEMVLKEDLLNHAASLVQEYPTHEALWMYIRAALFLSDSWPTQQTTSGWKNFVDHFVQPLAHSQHSNGGAKDDLTTSRASQYARNFLDRKMCHKSAQV